VSDKGIIRTAIYQEIETASGKQWVEIWVESAMYGRREYVENLTKERIQKYRGTSRGAVFRACLSVETEMDW
jgi:hypothetical protein